MTEPGGQPPPTPDVLPRYTTEQQRPLDVRVASVALSAGAGCGKTTVLTARFLGSLEAGPEALRSLVAVTFTEKAARELRQRIREACHGRLRQGGDAAESWLGVLRGLEDAPVSTFHKFCGGLLRRHALAAQIDPAFETLDALIADTVRDEAVGRFIRQCLASKDEDLVTLAVEYDSLERVSEALNDLVKHRDADRLGEWTDPSDEETLRRWRVAFAERLLPIRRRKFLTAGQDCADFWRAEDFDAPKLLEKRHKLLAELIDLPDRLDDSEWLGSLHELAKLPRLSKQEQWPSEAVKENASDMLKRFREAIKEWMKPEDDDEEGSRRAAGLGRRFARLGAAARLAYQAAKRARGGLDFDDLLLKTRDLLRDDPAVRQVESAAVTFVLVDEFQDTDPVQSEILRLLTGPGFTEGGLFVVGDFKQSIYRFRGARPKLFHEYRASFPEAGRLELTENFRSVPGVLDFVNALFHGAFEGESGRLIAGKSGDFPSAGPAVAFVWPVASERSQDEDQESGKKKGPGVSELRKTEALWLARLIRSRIARGWPIRDRKTRAVRDAHPGDVAMLFKAMTDLAPYERALAAEGLDYHVIGGSSFYAQDEVRDLINVLSVVEDPFDGVALAGALRSPFFGLSDNALCGIGAPEHGALARRFLGGEAREDLPAGDRDRFDRARNLLERWRSFKDRLPTGDLVDRVLEESGYEPALLGEPLGDRKRANARKLVRMAREFDAREGFTLAHFVGRLRTDLRDPPKEEQAATTDEEGRAVRLLSIHQSKGLEFPIVVLPDLNRAGPSRFGLVAFDPDLGPLVRGTGTEDAEDQNQGRGRTTSKSLGRKVFEEVERAEEEEEAIRLFYVATTRARDALILSAGGGSAEKPKSAALKRLEACFDRATGACLTPLPEGWAVPEVLVVESCPPSASGPLASRRAGLDSVARTIQETRLSVDRQRPTPSLRPSLVDLEALRLQGLPPRASRLADLVRAVLADPESLQSGGLARSARAAARRQVPGLPDRSADRVTQWLERPLSGLFDNATKIIPGNSWSVAWPPSSSEATVVLGWSDLLIRDGQGVWSVVIVSPPGLPEPLERLRGWLSSFAEETRGRSPMGPGWRVVLGESTRFVGEDLPRPGDIDAALDEAIHSSAQGFLS